jgi:hypothetical protein
VFHSLDRRFLYVAHKVEVLFLDNGVEKVFPGTCFFVSGPDASMWLVTNRHLLDAGYSKAERGHFELVEVRVSGFLPTTFDPYSFSILNPVPAFPENRLEDVAAIKVFKLDKATCALPLTPQQVPFQMLATDSDFSDLMLADVLLFPGFPEWQDRLEGRPILRRGALASDPLKNYLGPRMTTGGRALAYEAFSFGGSSGSPVFLPPFGVTLDGNSGGNFRPAKLLGINGGHFPIAGTGAHSGMSYFFRSTVLSEIILDGIV